MTWWHSLLIAAGVTFANYAAFVIWLVLAGRRQDARALAGFIPDCLLLFRRLLGDDAIIVALVLRAVLRRASPDLMREHRPGPDVSLNTLLRLAYGPAYPTTAK